MLQKKDELKLPVQRVAEEGQELAQKFLEDAWQMAKEYLNNSDNRKKIIEQGAKKAVDIAIKKCIKSNN